MIDQPIATNSKVYKKRLEGELKHYKEVFKSGKLFQDVPPVWDKVEACVSDAIEAACGVRSVGEYIAQYVKGKDRIMLLGLGSGSCGVELEHIAPILKKQGTAMELVCSDINEEVLAQAASEAKKRRIRFTPMAVDANTMELPRETYDVIVAYAALHHFLDLDYVIGQANKALKKDGILVTVDIPTKNGYMMWDETYHVVNNLFHSLPEQYRIDHTGYAEPKLIHNYENTNHAKTSFECVNSEAVLPALRAGLKEIVYAPTLTIGRRFFDTKFGPNYDLRKPLDNAIFDYIMRLDDYYLETGMLKPETFFGVYVKTNRRLKKASVSVSRPTSHRSLKSLAQTVDAQREYLRTLARRLKNRVVR